MNRRDTLKCLSGALLFPLLTSGSEKPMTAKPFLSRHDWYVTWVKYKKFHPEHKYENEILLVKLPSNRIFQLYVPRKGRLNKHESEGMLSSKIIQDHKSSSEQVDNDWFVAEDVAQEHFWDHIKPEYRRQNIVA